MVIFPLRLALTYALFSGLYVECQCVSNGFWSLKAFLKSKILANAIIKKHLLSLLLTYAVSAPR